MTDCSIFMKLSEYNASSNSSAETEKYTLHFIVPYENSATPLADWLYTTVVFILSCYAGEVSTAINDIDALYGLTAKLHALCCLLP